MRLIDLVPEDAFSYLFSLIYTWRSIFHTPGTPEVIPTPDGGAVFRKEDHTLAVVTDPEYLPPLPEGWGWTVGEPGALLAALGLDQVLYDLPNEEDLDLQGPYVAVAQYEGPLPF